jgi:hypothetical protein
LEKRNTSAPGIGIGTEGGNETAAGNEGEYQTAEVKLVQSHDTLLLLFGLPETTTHELDNMHDQPKGARVTEARSRQGF